MRLRSVELEVPDAGAAAGFLGGAWGLLAAGNAGRTQFFRGTGDHPYILSITPAAAPAIAAVTFSGNAEEISRIGKVNTSYDVPGGGKGLEVRGPEAQTYRFIIETSVPGKLEDRDKPIQLTHAVLNTVDQEA